MKKKYDNNSIAILILVIIALFIFPLIGEYISNKFVLAVIVSVWLAILFIFVVYKPLKKNLPPPVDLTENYQKLLSELFAKIKIDEKASYEDFSDEDHAICNEYFKLAETQNLNWIDLTVFIETYLYADTFYRKPISPYWVLKITGKDLPLHILTRPGARSTNYYPNPNQVKQSILKQYQDNPN